MPTKRQVLDLLSRDELGAGHRESLLRKRADEQRGPRQLETTPAMVYLLMKGINFYHFHDTSTPSPLRTVAKKEDDRYLRSDGDNLPAFLLSLRDSEDPSWRSSWNRIQGLVRLVAPFVREIKPVVAGPVVRLDWVDDRGETFGPSHLSDGTLRAIALLTALGQPCSGGGRDEALRPRRGALRGTRTMTALGF